MIEPLLVAQRPVAQPLAEDALQVGEALITEMMGEPHQRRRLNIRGRGDARRRAEGDLVGIAEREGGDLGKTLRHARSLRSMIVLRRLSKSRGTRASVLVSLSMPAPFREVMKQIFHISNDRRILNYSVTNCF